MLLAPPLVDPEPRGRMGAWATPKATGGRRSAVGGGAWARGDGGGVRQCREQRACVRAAPEVASGEWEARAQAASRAASCECARPFCAAFILPQLPPSPPSRQCRRPPPPVTALLPPSPPLSSPPSTPPSSSLRACRRRALASSTAARQNRGSGGAYGVRWLGCAGEKKKRREKKKEKG